jgi:hypothetical protein
VNPIAGWRQVLAGVSFAAIVLATPLVWRLAWEVRAGDAAPATPSYLPALELERSRTPFVSYHLDLIREVRPKFVVIGDSMAGRIDPDLLGELGGGPVVPILQNATGSAYWYLAFKNYVKASGLTPRWVILTFRDTNMTDLLFRLDGPYRPKLDEVAVDVEPELDALVESRLAGGWRSLHRRLDAMYHVERTREWLEPLITMGPARVLAGERAPQLLSRINSRFELERLRPIAQADMAAPDETTMDFGRYVNVSVLPQLLSEAWDAGLRVCLIRVLRRPADGAPAAQPDAMTRYSQDMRTFVEARGGVYFDDREAPELALLPYADGDHVAREAREPYTRHLWQRLQALEP